MARFILDYYIGEDLYSDGDIEKRILEVVESKKDVFDIAEYAVPSEYFTFLYHLSIQRENILNWYPFERGCKILEIGSGCGAITGMLCKNAGWVTSVELSKQRAKVNYARNRDVTNLEIIVGNLNDLQLKVEYDYVILNGVLEYACGFTKEDRPFQAFLEKGRKYLNPDGKLLLAIENRLGIKYFAGALEDHTDKCFWGIKQYPGGDSVRTFSKGELVNLLKQSGYSYQRFYYPYPDYKFPSEIFTDENINNGDYGRSGACFEKMNKRLFNEKLAITSLADEGVLDKFANSFLVEASTKKLNNEYISYAKLNSTRNKRFAIGTVIKTKRWKKHSVIKFPLVDEAIPHIKALYKRSKEGRYNLRGKYVRKSVEYPFIKGITLNEKIRRYVLDDKFEIIVDIVKEVSNKILGFGVIKRDFYTEKFVEIFGDCKIEEELECVLNVNIDMILDNVFDTRKGYVVIDCEWYTETEVPKKFLIWRILNEIFYQNPLLCAKRKRSWLMNEFEINDLEEECFRKWANYFAENYVSDPKLLKYQKQNQEIDITDYIKETISISTSIYIDTGKGFSEHEKMCNNIKIDKDGSFETVFDLSLWENIRTIRWDPLEGECVKCEEIVIAIDDELVEFESCNAEENVEGLFMNLDPQYVCKHVKKTNPQKIRIKGRILRLLQVENFLFIYEKYFKEQ